MSLSFSIRDAKHLQNNNKDATEALAAKIRYCIDNNLAEDLVTTLPAAEIYLLDRKELLFEAFFAAGEFRAKELDYFNSILYFNKSKKFNATIVVVFDKIIESLQSLYTFNKEEFVKGDLLKLLPPIKVLVDYYGALLNGRTSLEQAGHLMSRIAYRINFVAPDAVEGKMTHRVNVIINALEKDVPMDQVKKEVGKFIADLLQKRKIRGNNPAASNTDKK
jgi:hypothetical protein